MNTKTKSIIAVIVIFIITGIVATVYFKTKNQTQPLESAQVKPVETSTQDLEKLAKEDQILKTVSLEGTITKTSNLSITIKNGDAVNDIVANDNILVYAKNGDSVETKKFTDLKEGMKVKTQINQKDSTLIAIEILQ